MLTSVSAGK